MYHFITFYYLQDSKFPTYARMASFMESQKPKVFTSSNADGVDRVLESPGNLGFSLEKPSNILCFTGQYAFLMESNSIQYQTERNCELTQIGGLLDSKGYGIAFTPGNLILSTGDTEEGGSYLRCTDRAAGIITIFLLSAQFRNKSSILSYFTLLPH